MPDCKLQTLETFVLARTRRGDIPGADIPAAYHDFVETGDAKLLADILHHNLLDLTTMGQLVSKLIAQPAATASKTTSGSDHVFPLSSEWVR